MVKKNIIDKLRKKAMEEFVFFNQKANIQLDEDIDFAEEIVLAKNSRDLIDLMNVMAHDSCIALLSVCEDTISYYSNLFFDVKEYNDELGNLAKEFEDIISKKELDNFDELKTLFNDIRKLFIRLQQNKNNILKQSNWKFWTKIYPLWFSIISLFYLSIVGFLIEKEEISFSLFLVLGWLILLVLVWVFLRLVICRAKEPSFN